MRTTLLLILGFIFSHQTLAIGDAARPLQKQWAVAKYQTAEKEREKAMEKLAEKARETGQQHPKDPEVLVWEAIILSSYAGEKGGLGALGLVKEAKKLLEQAETIQPEVLDGSIYTSLGSLYYQVPGWPIGFGNDEKAEKYLKKALQINPDGIDANFFYGDFLLEAGRYKEAVQTLQKALDAPHRPDRKVADTGRRKEIKEKLQQAKQQL